MSWCKLFIRRGWRWWHRWTFKGTRTDEKSGGHEGGWAEGTSEGEKDEGLLQVKEGWADWSSERGYHVISLFMVKSRQMLGAHLLELFWLEWCSHLRLTLSRVHKCSYCRLECMMRFLPKRNVWCDPAGYWHWLLNPYMLSEIFCWVKLNSSIRTTIIRTVTVWYIKSVLL